MEKPKPNELTATEAAHNLALRVPDTDAFYWRSFLTNNRKKTRRVIHQVPFRKVGYHVYYDRDDLAAFAAKEKARRAAIAAAVTGRERSRTGRTRSFKWAVDARHGEAAPHTVRLKVTGFTVLLPLTPTEARQLAGDLMRFANRLEQKERT